MREMLADHVKDQRVTQTLFLNGVMPMYHTLSPQVSVKWSIQTQKAVAPFSVDGGCLIMDQDVLLTSGAYLLFDKSQYKVILNRNHMINYWRTK
jgi:hypothetical protein